MKRLLVSSLCAALIICAAGCGTTGPAEDPGSEIDLNSAECRANGFEMALFSDNTVYKTTDIIQIWATLAYTGPEDTVTIWHGIPYISFSITDGKDFNVEGLTLTVLASTVLNKGEVYRHDYEKSGGYGEDDPDADFWRAFYAEKDLILPPGAYTISAGGAFSLTETVTDSPSGLLCELKINVAEQ